MKKQLVTLDINNYNPEITKWTLPTIKHYAHKIGAELKVITEPVFKQPGFVTYEKFQIYELAKGYDWTIFLDIDTLVYPDTPDFSEGVTKDIVLFHGLDVSLNRFRPTNYTRRSGILAGACTWNVWCSDWTRDIWHPMQETTFDECISNIFPTIPEIKSGCCDAKHLIDDYS